MFNSKKLFAALFALAFSCSTAFAQIPVTGAGTATTDSTSADPVSNACINSSGTTITFTAQGTGNAKAGRVSVVTINWDDSTAAGTAELTAMTIGGISMVRQIRAVGDDQNSNSEVWYAANPTGTTANIVATFSTAVDGITIEVYSLVGYQSVTATTTGTTSVSQAYTNKQVAIAAASRRVNVSTSLSNMTNDFSSACGASLWGVHASQKLNGNGTLSSTISPTSNTPLIALAVWQVPVTATCTASMAGTVVGNWDASVTASLTLGAGNKVTNWADNSGFGNNLGDGTTTAKPVYSATSFNTGFPGLATANASGSIVGSNFAFGTGNTATFYYVGTFNSLSSVNGRIFAYWDGSNSDFSSVGSFIFLRPGGTQTAAIMRATIQTTASAMTYDAPTIWIGTISSAGVMTLYTNGVAGITNTSSGNFVSNGRVSLASSISDVSGVTGQLAEAALSNGFTNSTNVATLYNCLKVKWGL